MNQNQASLIKKQLRLFDKIKFNAYFVTKGCQVDIEIGENRNEKCGEIFELLQEWLGYGEFLDYIIENGGYGNFHGEFTLENNEVFIFLTLNAGDLYEEAEEKYIYFEEEFFTEELKIDLVSIGMDDFLENDHIILDFDKEKNKPFEGLSLYYFDDTKPRVDSNDKNPYSDSWHHLELTTEQTNILISFVEQEIQNHLPEFNVSFDCEILWSVQCEDKILQYWVYTSPIRIKLSDFFDAED
jgi:hypothetical protein